MRASLADRASSFLGAHTSRRGFLRRAAMVGSALVAAPATYILRPGSAYSAVVTTPSDCPPGTRCRSGGYTQFCCTTTGVNTCPPGTAIAGWWRAEDTGYCSGGSRYYMDCNATSCGGCDCGGSGTCSPSCAGTACRCANDDCGNWKVGCTQFRYGQCNQDIKCMGPIQCRVITCVPPWEWDSSCTRTDAVDPNTRAHDAPCLHPFDTGGNPPVTARPGVVLFGRWSLRDSLSAGGSDSSFEYGLPGDVPVMGDWTGSGIETPGVVRGVRHSPSGDGTLTWYLRQVPGTGRPDAVVEFGGLGDVPVVGDWNGDGTTTIGVVRGNRWLLRNSNTAGPADLDFRYGDPADVPVVGDWNADRVDSPGVVRGGQWRLRNSVSAGPPDVQLEFSGSGIPIAGDWSGSGQDRPGWFDSGLWRIRTSLTSGGPTSSFGFGDPDGAPLVWGRIQ